MHNVDSRGFLAFLLLTALACGALVMVIEVLGSRVIGPFFGVSLFVWTALITATLVALAAGYAAGGWLADRRPSSDWLYGIVLAAGALVLLIPAVKTAVLEACVPLGLRAGALAAAGLLFGPPLFCLGCVSPYLVRIASREPGRLGRTVGGLYAISTAGSFLGTVATGFFLIAWLGVSRIFVLAGALLIALAVVHFVVFRRRLASLAALALPLLLGPADPLPQNTQPDGTVARLMTKVDSYYGDIKVVDYRYGATHTRELMIDGLVQGGIDVASGLSVYEYSYVLQFLPRALYPAGRSCLVIGLGAGVVPRWYAAEGVATDVIDIDPAVVETARRWFGHTTRGRVFVEDARYVLGQPGTAYDYVVLDVFNGDVTPGYLLSREAVQTLRARITPDGVLAINLIASLRGDTYMTASVVRTLRSAFDQVELHAVFDTTAHESGNVVLIAYAGPARRPDLSTLRDRRVHPLAANLVHTGLEQTASLPPGAPAVMLTDDYNPIDIYDVGLKETVRRTIVETTDWDILGY